MKREQMNAEEVKAEDVKLEPLGLPEFFVGVIILASAAALVIAYEAGLLPAVLLTIGSFATVVAVLAFPRSRSFAGRLLWLVLRPWGIPVVLMTLLLLAYAFRWQTEATRSSGNAIVRWQRDRWTNTVWVARFTTTNYSRYPAAPYGDPSQEIADAVERATRLWVGLTAGSGAWLVACLVARGFRKSA